MTDAGIPMGEGREQRAREVLAQVLPGYGWSESDKQGIVLAMLAFADTPPPAAAGDRSVARSDFEALCNAVEYLERYNLMPKERRSEARAALDALRTPEPDNGGEPFQ